MADAAAAAGAWSSWARRGRPAQPWALRIAPCWAAGSQPPSPGRCPVPRRRRGEPAAGVGHLPAAGSAELPQRARQQRVRQQEAHHPGDPGAVSRRHRGPASLSGPGLRRARAANLDVRAAASERHRGSAWPSVRGWRLEPVIPQPGAHQDVRRGAAYRGGQPAACCLEPASRSAQESLSVKVLLQVQAWPERAHPVSPSAPQVPATVSPWAQARAVPQDPLQAAAVASGEPQAAVVWARAAAEPRRAAWEPGAPRAVQEAAHAVAEPQPGAAKAASGRQAAVGAAAVPDGPQVAAEAVAALPGAAVRQPAEAPRADGVVQLRAAVRPGARAPQAARPLAVPSVAASVFRQGRFLVAPGRRRAATRLAHAMRSLRIASRSEPWWQAARNEN